jgi:hypothetical protein
LAGDAPRTWILTGSPENFEATREHGFALIGCKERRLRQAQEMEPGDRIVLYLTRRMCFAASVIIAGEMFEDRTPVWPGKPGKRVAQPAARPASRAPRYPNQPDAYPWRFATEPELVLDEADWLAAESLVDELEHIGKWPREHWKLAFQGQLRTISEADSGLLLARMRERAGVRA